MPVAYFDSGGGEHGVTCANIFEVREGPYCVSSKASGDSQILWECRLNKASIF